MGFELWRSPFTERHGTSKSHMVNFHCILMTHSTSEAASFMSHYDLYLFLLHLGIASTISLSLDLESKYK